MTQVKFDLDGIEYEVPSFMNLENYAKIFKIKDILSEDYFAAKLIHLMTGAPVEKLLEADFNSIQYLSTYIMTLFPNEEEKFVDKFELEGVRYGFIPSWKKMTFAEYVDLDTLFTKKRNELLDYIHIIMAILYRPITHEPDKKEYKIEKYDYESMQERAELFKKHLDIKYYVGAQFFFIKFEKKYSDLINPSSITTMTLKDRIKFLWRWRKMIKWSLSRKSSDGLPSSTELVQMILQNMDSSLKKPWWKRLTN